MISRWTTVDLGRHVFGKTRAPEPIFRATWGNGIRELGRDGTAGPSSFDVSPDERIVVLDELNRRLAVYPLADPAHPRYVRIRFPGQGDLAIAPDGTTYVLDDGTTPHSVRSYSPSLKPLAGGRLMARWRVRSATPLGSVQVADPLGKGLLVVLALSTEKKGEWQVLRLSPKGLSGKFSVRRVTAVDSAALSRFRLHGNSLYALESGESGARIVRYRLATS